MKDKSDFLSNLMLLGGYILILVAIALMSMMCGCTRTQYVPIENNVCHTDTLYRERMTTRVDSFIQRENVYVEKRDSIAPILDSLQRVVGYDRWHFTTMQSSNDRERLQLMAAVDSLRQLRTDSIVIREPYPVVTVKEVNRLHWWQTVLMCLGVVVVAYAGYVIYLIIRRWRNG